MRSGRDRDLDRRTFLKLGASGTAMAAINPSIAGASEGAGRTLSSPPTLADMASDRLTYRLRDLFNCPLAMNEWATRKSRNQSPRSLLFRFHLTLVCGVPETP